MVIIDLIYCIIFFFHSSHIINTAIPIIIPENILTGDLIANFIADSILATIFFFIGFLFKRSWDKIKLYSYNKYYIK